jgi:glucose/arabinose dehydrogenase
MKDIKNMTETGSKKHIRVALAALALSAQLCVSSSADTKPMAAATAAPGGAAGTSAVTSAAVQPGAVKSVWASGLRAPQGMARDAAGNVYVAEYQGGQVSKFSSEGKAWAPSAQT